MNSMKEIEQPEQVILFQFLLHHPSKSFYTLSLTLYFTLSYLYLHLLSQLFFLGGNSATGYLFSTRMFLHPGNSCLISYFCLIHTLFVIYLLLTYNLYILYLSLISHLIVVNITFSLIFFFFFLSYFYFLHTLFF